MSAPITHAGSLAGDPASPVHRLDPRAKVLGLTGITLVVVSAAAPDWPVLAVAAVALAAIAAAARVPAGVVWSRGRIVIPLVLFAAAFLPFVRGGPRVDLGPVALSREGLVAFAAVTSKAVLGTVSAVLLTATTSFADVLHALERLRAPRVLTLIAALMYRYVFVIAGEARRMRTALTARGYAPRHALQLAALGRVATALFLRTYERGERVHVAMLARGYTGPMPRLRTLALARADMVFLSTLAAALLPLRVLCLA